MDVKETRLNRYRDSNDWKPYHHDAAAVKPDKGNIPKFNLKPLKVKGMVESKDLN